MPFQNTMKPIPNIATILTELDLESFLLEHITILVVWIPD